MEAFSRLLKKGREENLIEGVVIGRGDRRVEILHLFFADDTLIFCQLKERMMLHLRCILLCFQAVSGLDINLKKSELLRMRDNQDRMLGVRQ